MAALDTPPTFAVITGGGTAGHVLPALAIAEALEEHGHDASTLHYVGSERGIETRLLPASPYPHTLLDVVGVQRNLSARNATFVPKLFHATRRARVLLAALHPRVVVSVGGYASLPSVLAARRLRIPVVVISFDRRPGRASALAARFAAGCRGGLPGLHAATGRAHRCARAPRNTRDVDRVTGRAATRRQLGLPADRFVVAAMGGSLGSGVLNDAITCYLKRHRGDTGLAIRHAVGERNARQAPAARTGSGGAIYQPIAFEDRMDLVYTAADVLVGRGGATTVAEVAVTGTPAVLVPWSGAAEDHQTANVAWLADQGAAVALAEADIGELGGLLDSLRADGVRREALGERAHGAGAVHRSDRIPHMIERVALASNLS